MSDLRTQAVSAQVPLRNNGGASILAPHVSFSNTVGGLTGDYSPGVLKTLFSAELLLRLQSADLNQRQELARLIGQTILENRVIEPEEIRGVFDFLAEGISLDEINDFYGGATKLKTEVRGFLTEVIGDDHFSGEIVDALLPGEEDLGRLDLDTEKFDTFLTLSPAIGTFLDINDGQSQLSHAELVYRLNYLKAAVETNNYKVPESLNTLLLECKAFNEGFVSNTLSGFTLGVLEHNLRNISDSKVNSFVFRRNASVLLERASKTSDREHTKAIDFLKQLTELSINNTRGTQKLLNKVLKKIEKKEDPDGLYLEASMILHLVEDLRAEDLRNGCSGNSAIEVSYTQGLGRPEVDFMIMRTENGEKKTYFGECKTSVKTAVEKIDQRRKLLDLAQKENSFVVYIVQNLNKDLLTEIYGLMKNDHQVEELDRMLNTPKIRFWSDSGEDITESVRGTFLQLKELKDS